MIRVLVLLSLAMSFSAWAGPFTLRVTNYGTTNTTLRGQVDTLFKQVEDEVNKSLPAADQSTFLKGMSNATVMSGKGVGVDYGNAIDVFVVGLGAGVGVDLAGSSFSDLTSGKIDQNHLPAVGVSPGIMAGVNMGVFPLNTLGPIDFNRMTIYLHYLGLDRKGTIKGGSYNVEARSMGLHVKYSLLDGRTLIPFFVKWGGLDISTGFESDYFKMTYSKTFTETKTQTLSLLGQSANVSGSYTGTATAGADVSVSSIPIALTTNFQLLYALTTYFGLATDINFGSAKSIANVTGTMTPDAKTATTGAAWDAACGGSACFASNPSAQAGLDLGDKGGPSALLWRGIVGAQVNIWILKVVAELDKGLGNDLWGVTGSARIAW